MGARGGHGSGVHRPDRGLFPGGGSLRSGFRWGPGWYAPERGVNWLYFWWLNWGLTPVLALVAVALGARDRARRRATLSFFFPYAVMFAFANLFVVHAWAWDNTKILVWASVGVSALAALALGALWGDARGRVAWRALASLLFAGMIASGAIDVYRMVLPSARQATLYSREEVLLAEWARRETPLDAVWLTGEQHNHWLFNLTGRQPVMAYPGWLWTHGYAYNETARDVRKMYKRPDQDVLFRKYQVAYVAVGPAERDDLQANEAGFAALSPSSRKRRTGKFSRSPSGERIHDK